MNQIVGGVDALESSGHGLSVERVAGGEFGRGCRAATQRLGPAEKAA